MEIRKISLNGINEIAKWCEGVDEAFLRQWTGGKYLYPFSAEQMRLRLEKAKIFQIEEDKEIIGSVEMIRENEEKRSAHIGCYLINPSLRGNGLGTKAMKEIVAYCKSQGFKLVTLNVFDFNKPAVHCYQKVGFMPYDKQKFEDFYVINMQIEP